MFWVTFAISCGEESGDVARKRNTVERQTSGKRFVHLVVNTANDLLCCQSMETMASRACAKSALSFWERR